jgi:hypothetical protein
LRALQRRDGSGPRDRQPDLHFHSHQQAAPEHREKARKVGIGLALVMRLALLGTVAWIVKLTTPVFEAVRPRLLLEGHDPDRRWPVPALEGNQGNPPQCRSGRT